MEEAQAILEDANWQYLATLLPGDLEETARQSGALQRRREIKSALMLLRVVLLYCFCGLSLSQVSLWWSRVGLGKLTKRAIEMRLKKSSRWMGRLVGQKLSERTSGLSESLHSFRIRLVDATVVNRPGSEDGIDWRLHVGLDLTQNTMDEIKLSRGDTGESFRNFEIAPGDLMVGDRGYAHRSGIDWVLKQGGDVLVRFPWRNLPFENKDGSKFDLLGALRTLEGTAVGDFQLQTAPDVKRGIAPIKGRVIAVTKSPEATEKARQTIIQQAKKSGSTLDSGTLEAAGYIFVFTTLPSERIQAPQVLELYRYRWQIELEFKRLKGILSLDVILVQDEEMCRTFLLAKLLGALLVEELAGKCQDFSPWGYGLPTTIFHTSSVYAH